MKYTIITTILALLLSACAGQPPRAEVDPTQRIQTIPVTSENYLHAQNDILVDHDSLVHELSARSPEWKSQLAKASSYKFWTNAAVFVQFATLIPCFTTAGTDLFLWCGASIASGVAGMGLVNKSQRAVHKVVEDYNQQFTTKAGPN